MPSPTSNLPRPPSKEIRSLGALALPVILAQIGQFAMGLEDTMMVGHVSETALAAVALGNSFGWCFFLLAMGVLMGLDPLISQAYGAGKIDECGHFAQAGLILATLLAIPILLILYHSAFFLRLLGQQEELVILASQYLRAVLPGIFPFFIFIALRQFIQALGLMKPVMVVVLLANGINILANWAFIYGHLGITAMGSTGAGYATMVSKIFLCLGLLFYVLTSPKLKAYPWKPSFSLSMRFYLGKLLWMGVPIGMQLALEVWSFSMVAFLMGWMGKLELAGHQIAMNLAALVWMVPVGLGAASCVRVGHSWGRQDPQGARQTARVALTMVLVTASISATIFALLPIWLAGLYTNQPNLILMAATLLPMAAVFQLADGLQAVSFGILRGMGDTRFPTLIVIFGYWMVGLPFGYFYAFHGGGGPQGLWWGLVVGLTLVATLLVLRVFILLRKGNYQNS